MHTYPVLRVTKRTSEQKIFDAVVEHLRRQGKRSKSQSGPSCLYRGPGGTACAVGALLTDKEAASIEGNSVYDIALPDRLLPHRMLLAELQLAHDRQRSAIALNEDLETIANTHHLKFTNPIEKWS